MNTKNLIIVGIVILGGYFVYKKFYKPKPIATTGGTKPLPNAESVTNPIDSKGDIVPVPNQTTITNPTINPITNPNIKVKRPTNTSSFNSFDEEGL